MALEPDEFARRDRDSVEYRIEPMRVNWSLAHLPTADAHTLDCRFSASVRIADNAVDRRMFAEVLLAGREALTAEQIAEHFSSALRTSLEAQVSQCKAADVIGGERRQALIDGLTRAAEPVAFACGLEIIPPFAIDLRSESLSRELHDERISVRLKKALARSAELLDQFRSVQQSAPQLSAGQILEQLSPDERGQGLQSLLLASADQSQPADLWAVAGPMLVRIDLTGEAPRVDCRALSDELGPLRSVTPRRIDGRELLLIGGQRGVGLVDPENPSDLRTYLHPALESPLGFNSVVWHDGLICASHSDAGIVCWPLNAKLPQQIYSDRQDKSGPKFLGAMNAATLIYAVNHAAILRRGDHRELIGPSQAAVVGIVSGLARVLIVRDDGTIQAIDRESNQISEITRRSERLCAAGALPWMGDMRLLLASESGSIRCVGLDDSVVTEFAGPYRGMKMVAGSGQRVAAVSPDRQRIVIWQSWNGQKPIADIHITGQAHHRVADIHFAAATA